MAVKVAINGFGRIGRLAYRAMVEQGLVGNEVEVVAVGDLVGAGDTIGAVGDTGSLIGPQLYFEIRLGGDPLDPGEWLRGIDSR